MLPMERSREDGIICHSSLSSLTPFCLSDFFPVSTQARFLEPSSNAALLGWFGRRKALSP